MLPEQIVLLSLIQGMTEFLPVSSSGHLALVPLVAGWKDQGMTMDVAAHMGTLFSVIVYFFADVLRLIRGAFHAVLRRSDYDSQLFWNIVIATVPGVVMGGVFEAFVGDTLRNIYVIAALSILFGLFLYAGDRWGRQYYTVTKMTRRHAVVFGIAQCFALMNGASRSGVCITAGRFLGYKRVDAARFSFLMSMPIILGAGLVKGYQVLQMDNSLMLNEALYMAGLSFLFGLMAITFMMRWLESSSLTPFVIYRVILGGLLIALAYGGVLNPITSV